MRSLIMRALAKTLLTRALVLVAVATVVVHVVWLNERAAALQLCRRQIDSATPVVPGDVLHGAIAVRPSRSAPEHVERGDVVDVVAGPAGTWLFEVNDDARTLHATTCHEAVARASPAPVAAAAVRLVRFASFGRLGCARDMKEARIDLGLIAHALDEARRQRGAYPDGSALDEAIGARQEKHIGFRYTFVVRSAPDSFEARALGVEGRVAGDVWAVSRRPGEGPSEPIHLVDGCTLSSALQWR
jgi:hypothetical protein